MFVYIILILFIVIFIVSDTTKRNKDSKSSVTFLTIIFIFIYLLCALRSSSVGRDVAGYEMVYNWTVNAKWNDWDYVYYEKGYILLMKICVLFRLPFQGFLAVAYAIIVFPIYLIIRKYSYNYGISTLLYVCFQHLNFDLSGIRQALSMSIVLIGYVLLIESKKYSLLKYTLCVIIASTFHTGAFICFVFVIAYLVKSMPVFYIGSAISLGVLYYLRNYLMIIIQDWFERNEYDLESRIYIGANFLMTVAFVALFIMYLNYTKNKLDNVENSSLAYYSDENHYLENVCKEHFISTINVKMYIISFAAMILFGTSNMVRSYMYLNQVYMIILPNLLESNMFKSKEVIKIAVVIVFIAFFVYNVLINGGFDIVPYKFFWQTA